ncbi:BCCT family transporter [Micrococcus porci]|uniref:BCCT family transporter n=1 Tax=Micrococcus porci TaxID=2856555 RepID=UPI001CCCF2D2|nr:BCCT family transporter [Micrococcus porci]UBH24803.1 BCCT family transporter [Micrococcus porci]
MTPAPAGRDADAPAANRPHRTGPDPDVKHPAPATADQADRGHAGLLPWVFWPSTLIVLLFVVATLAFPAQMTDVIGDVQAAIIRNFSWWYAIVAFAFVVFCAYLVFSRKGSITLGKPDEKPEFSTMSWFALLFAAGMGIGLVFFGMTEPLMHFTSPRPDLAAANPTEAQAAQSALATTFLHWGLQPWAIYAVVGVAVGLAIHRRGRPLSLRWAFEPLLGERRVRGGWGHLIDNIALIGTVFGVATSLGLGVTQMAAGLRSLGIVPADSPWLEYAMIAAVTCVVMYTVVSGVERGMKWLSNINLVLAAGLLLFIALVGPTPFLLKETVQSFGAYLQNFFADSLNVSAFYGAEGDAWQAGWTAYYWGWWMSWTPFVGIFIARISRGRTVREFLMGVLLVPTLVCVVWFGILGGTAIWLETVRPAGYTSVVGADGAIDSNSALFQVLEQLPAGLLLVIGAIILSGIFFVTSADSGALVMGMLATGGDVNPKTAVKIFFAIATAFMAAALLAAGGLSAIQTLAITIGLPFSVLMLVMCVATFRSLGYSAARVEAVRRQAMLASIQDRLGKDTDDDEVVEGGPVAASQWWASLSRDHQRTIARLASPGPDDEIRLHEDATATSARPDTTRGGSTAR